jgi:CRISPR-associated protein Cmr4
MFKKASPFFMFCESAMHAGTGDNLGIVDLPIQREKHTGFPKIEGSSLKGAVREAFEEKATDVNAKTDVHRIFGYDDAEKDDEVKAQFKDKTDYAGAVGFTDARLLLFPVKSMKGVYAWITCPAVLNRFFADMEIAKVNHKLKNPVLPNDKALITTQSQLKVTDKDIILEEYSFSVTTDENVEELAQWIADSLELDTYQTNKLKKDIVVLKDDDFRDFVQMSTEVVTRIKINNETGTVAQGQLFSEEFLPAESLLYSLILVSPLFSPNKNKLSTDKSEGNQSVVDETKVLDYVKNNINKCQVMQIGGDATIGKGIVRTKLMEV